MASNIDIKLERMAFVGNDIKATFKLTSMQTGTTTEITVQVPPNVDVVLSVYKALQGLIGRAHQHLADVVRSLEVQRQSLDEAPQIVPLG